MLRDQRVVARKQEVPWGGVRGDRSGAHGRALRPVDRTNRDVTRTVDKEQKMPAIRQELWGAVESFISSNVDRGNRSRLTALI